MHANDATAAGWAMTFGYAYCVLLIVFMMRRWIPRVHPDDRTTYQQFWMFLLLVYAFLGVNKQLDLQTFITATGRCMARIEGWYADRRNIQLIIILVGLVAGSIGLIGFHLYFSRIARRCIMAMIGLGLSGLYVALRAVSFQHADELLNLRLLNVKLYSFLEIAGVLLVSLNAISLAFARTRRPRRDYSYHEPVVPGSSPLIEDRSVADT